jgi:hypothetical protein
MNQFDKEIVSLRGMITSSLDALVI